MIQLSPKWAPLLLSSPEAGMGYQVVTIVLKDGTRFDQVVVAEGCITQVRGRYDIPFVETDIEKMIVTNDKWDFGRES